MNIVVQRYAHNRVYARPDTSWERENRDIFVPDHVKGYFFSPIIFVKISKAGRFISPKFASRYFESINFGILLYEEESYKEGDIASASCQDHTSILPSPMYNKLTLESGENTFSLLKDKEVIFKSNSASIETIEAAISLASKNISLRIGDFLAIELQTPELLANRDNGLEQTSIHADFCDNSIFDFKIIF